MRHLLALLLGLGVMSSPLCDVATSAPDVMPSAVRESQLDELHLRTVERARALARGRDVTLRILYPKGSELCVVATGKAFQELTGIRIEYVESTIDDINMEVQTTALLESAHFDIALPATFGIPGLVESGAISRLDDLASRYEPAGFKEQFLYPIANLYKGNFYGYLTDGDSYLAFYNGKMLNDPRERQAYKAKYGSELGIPQTWAELDRIAEL